MAKREARPTYEDLQEVLGEMYQFAGSVGAPVRVLDQVLAAAEGRPLPHASILPISFDECNPPKRHRPSSADAAKKRDGRDRLIAVLWEQDYTMAEIATRANCTMATVTNVVRQLRALRGTTIRRPGGRGTPRMVPPSRRDDDEK